MNVIIVTVIIVIVALFAIFLMGRRCHHQWDVAETWQQRDHRVVYIMRCKKCGEIKKKVLK